MRSAVIHCNSPDEDVQNGTTGTHILAIGPFEYRVYLDTVYRYTAIYQTAYVRVMTIRCREQKYHQFLQHIYRFFEAHATAGQNHVIGSYQTSPEKREKFSLIITTHYTPHPQIKGWRQFIFFSHFYYFYYFYPKNTAFY